MHLPVNPTTAARRHDGGSTEQQLSERTFDWPKLVASFLRAERHIEELHDAIEQTVDEFKPGRCVAVDGTHPALVADTDVARFVLEDDVGYFKEFQRQRHALVARQGLQDARK